MQIYILFHQAKCNMIMNNWLPKMIEAVMMFVEGSKLFVELFVNDSKFSDLAIQYQNQ